MQFLKSKKKEDSVKTDLISLSDQFIAEQEKEKQHHKQIEDHIKSQQERLVKLMGKREEITRKSQHVIPVLEEAVETIWHLVHVLKLQFWRVKVHSILKIFLSFHTLV